MLFTDIESCILNHGHSSGFFHPGRGVRQGCPLSPSLFVLVVEILAAKIRKNSNIRGLQLGEHTLKLSQFTDDLTGFLADEDSLSEFLTTLLEFQEWSGLMINRRKSKLLRPSTEDRSEDSIEDQDLGNLV